jgi:hypothetical protein
MRFRGSKERWQSNYNLDSPLMLFLWCWPSRHISVLRCLESFSPMTGTDGSESTHLKGCPHIFVYIV